MIASGEQQPLVTRISGTRWHGIFIGVLLLAAGCGGGSSATDGGTNDAASPASDARVVDASFDDARMVDAASEDALVVDASALDAMQFDAGMVDPNAYIRQPTVAVPAVPPAPDLSGYPTDSSGNPILATGTRLYLYPRAADALTARSLCTGRIVNCVDPAVMGKNIDACTISVPACATEQPWLETEACCPTSCVTRYEELRNAGTPPITAFRTAFYGAPSCSPGVDTLLGGN